jgi:hypothetical protein
MTTRSVILLIDVKSDEGRTIIHQLVCTADILVENFGPGTMQRLGSGYEAIRALNARLMYLSLKGFLHSPYEQCAALDEIVQMMGGLAYMTGPPGQPLRADRATGDRRNRPENPRRTSMNVVLQQEKRLAEAAVLFVEAIHQAFPAVATRPIPPYDDEDFTILAPYIPSTCAWDIRGFSVWASAQG